MKRSEFLSGCGCITIIAIGVLLALLGTLALWSALS
jgi:hypothetical protein